MAVQTVAAAAAGPDNGLCVAFSAVIVIIGADFIWLTSGTAAEMIMKICRPLAYSGSSSSIGSAPAAAAKLAHKFSVFPVSLCVCVFTV